MIKKITSVFVFGFLFSVANAQLYHPLVTDTGGKLIPWYDPNPSLAYDHDLSLIWNFWKNFPSTGGVKDYMTDHSYGATQKADKIGGDQFAMAMSSWALYYAYTGDSDLIANMTYIADTYLANSLSAATDSWPNIPYACNVSAPATAVYDGDYLLGANVAQPDKAASFGAELVTLYKITGNNNYLQAAVNIANTLAARVQPGDATHSPYIFKVNAVDGSNPLAINGVASSYCGNVTPELRLFENLKALNAGNTVQYDTAYAIIKRWVRNYPEQTNSWGSFFEDIFFPSNTEINSVTMAYYILQHPNWSSTYQQEARSILDWTLTTFTDTVYQNVGVTAIYEQTADLKPGGSHTSRYASTELLYSLINGDTSKVAEAVRQLNWATYLCDTSGACRFSPAEGTVWLTDGYGDYVRHFLRAMAAYPTIAPETSNHLLGSSSVVTHISYQPTAIRYYTYDNAAEEVLRVTAIPLKVKVNNNEVPQLSTLNGEGWTWTPYATGGVLKINHTSGTQVDILWNLTSVPNVAANEMAFQLYPNPAKGTVNIKYSLNREEAVKVEVLDAVGQLVASMHLTAHTTTDTQELTIANLLTGIYFVRMNSAEGQVVRKLVVEQ